MQAVSFAADLFSQGPRTLIDDREGGCVYHPAFIDAARADAWFAQLRDEIEWRKWSRPMYDRVVDVPRLTSGYTLDDASTLPPVLAAAEENGPKDFEHLLQVPGVGARTVRALAMVAEVLHGTPCRFTDPARFSLAHGGKDRHPFPVPTKVYDHTIGVLKSAVRNARLGREDELGALRRLDAQARALERTATGPSVEDFIDEERRHSHEYGGRSIFGWEPPAADAAREPAKLDRTSSKRKHA